MEAESRPTGGRDLMLVGFVIVLIGAAALVSELWPDFDRYLPLAVGIGLLGVFLVNRSYLALVGGGITTGLGTGLLLAQVFQGQQADGVGALLGLGGGFIGVWLVSVLAGLKERHWWPLVPGTILLTIGTGLAFDALAQPLVGPAILVLIGVLLMGVAFVRVRQTHARGTV